MKKVLLTGFEPFAGQAENPSQMIAQRLDGLEIDGARVVGAVLPVVFGQSIRELTQLIREVQPAVVICLGQAGGRDGITPERVAVNLDDAGIDDNAGQRPVRRPVVDGGPWTYPSTLPLEEIVAALRSADIPASLSSSAGSFVCNHVFYGLMHALRELPGVSGGFAHVPNLPEQGVPGTPSLPLEVMVEGITLAIRATVRSAREVVTV
jgi:pyroglutamyl-peptidase